MARGHHIVHLDLVSMKCRPRVVLRVMSIVREEQVFSVLATDVYTMEKYVYKGEVLSNLWGSTL